MLIGNLVTTATIAFIYSLVVCVPIMKWFNLDDEAIHYYCYCCMIIIFVILTAFYAYMLFV